MVADSVPWLPDAIYSAWRWTQPEMREDAYENTRKIIQNVEALKEHLANLEAVIKSLEDSLDKIKTKNEASLQAKRQLLEMMRMLEDAN
jgi:Skp family chaperone for outer membrane proteins